MKKVVCAFLLLLTSTLFAENDSIFTITKSSNLFHEISLDKHWKYNPGDDIMWAQIKTNDSSWKEINPDFTTNEFKKMEFNGIGWFRLHLYLPEGMEKESYALRVSQKGASQFFLDGEFIHAFGTPGKEKKQERKFNPNDQPFIIHFNRAGNHVLAVRYSNHTAIEMMQLYDDNDAGFTITLSDPNLGIKNAIKETLDMSVIFIFLFTFFITIAFIHFLLFLFYRAQKSNLYYSAFIFLFSLFYLFVVAYKNTSDPDTQSQLMFNVFFIIPIFFTALLGFIFSLFYAKIPKFYWYVVGTMGLILILKLLRNEPGIVSFSFICMTTVSSAIEVSKAIIKKKKGAWAIGFAAISFISLILIFLLKNALGFGSNIVIGADKASGMILMALLLISILGIPISMSIFLARDFASTSKSLSKKLIEVETLSAKSIEQEKEKQKILETQKDLLEIQVEERTHEIVEQKKLIEEKNKDITDSINYAKRIQEAILPEQANLNAIFKDAFVLFKPKDIVSGDFYWFAEHKDKKIVAVADCTGHGVPGALMSMIGANILSKLVLEGNITQPDQILNKLNEEVRTALKQRETASETRDGMDIAIISIFGNQLQYAGAHRPLYRISQSSFEEIKADKFPIGGIQQEENRVYTNHTITLQENDTIYLSSDGFADQFGGNAGKKLMTKHFKELLFGIKNDPMKNQKIYLDDTIEKWKGAREQVDDILVIGIKY